MTLSPIAHTVSVEVEHATRDAAGRVVQTWDPLLNPDGSPVVLSGPLAQGGPEETALWGQQQHDVIYQLVVREPRYGGAKPGDRFRDEAGRLYYVRGIDDTSSAGRWTIYYASVAPSGA